jgi:hypothetical protein
MSERFVIVHRSYDPIQAEMLGEILRDAAIAARVLGTRSAAQVGVGPSAMQVHIEVPASQAGPATDFLESYFAGGGERLLEEAGVIGYEPDPEENAEEQGEPPLRPLFAAATSLILSFGAGYLYARRPFTAAVLAAGQIVAWVGLASAAAWSHFLTFALGLVLLRLIELVGAQLACRAHNRGVRRRAPAQLALGAAVLGGVLAASSAVAAVTPPPSLDRGDEQALPPHLELAPL